MPGSCASCHSNWRKTKNCRDYVSRIALRTAYLVTQGRFSLVRARQRILASGDGLHARVFQLVSLGRVEFDIFRELGRKVRLLIDGVDGTYVYTCHAINAVLRVNDHLVVHFVEAGDRTHLHTVGELASVTFIGDDMRHGISCLRIAWKELSLTSEVFQ